jgi:hypothetical protein
MKFQYFLFCIFVIPQLFFYKSDPSSVLKKITTSVEFVEIKFIGQDSQETELYESLS